MRGGGDGRTRGIELNEESSLRGAWWGMLKLPTCGNDGRMGGEDRDGEGGRKEG